MASRYELTEAQWNCIRDLLPGRKESVGRTAADNRVCLQKFQMGDLRSTNLALQFLYQRQFGVRIRNLLRAGPVLPG
jgi:hypothetical protein